MKFILGLLAGCLATAGIMWLYLTPVQEATARKSLDVEKENQLLQQQIIALSMSLKANEAELEGLQKEGEETEQHLQEYQRFVSAVLDGDETEFPYEIIADDEEKTVVYAPTYREVPSNTDLQKLFILRIINQLPEFKGHTFTLWSGKESAQLFAADTYPKNEAEGWSGMNAKFATLQKENGEVHLWHHLSVHEADPVGFGQYAP